MRFKLTRESGIIAEKRLELNRGYFHQDGKHIMKLKFISVKGALLPKPAIRLASPSRLTIVGVKNTAACRWSRPRLKEL